MQYSSGLDRDGLTRLVQEQLLAALAKGDVDAAVACVHDQAHFCVQTHFMTASGKAAIGEAFGRYAKRAGTTSLSDVQPIVDAKNGRVTIACAMQAEGSAEPQSNTLFFRIRDDKVQDMYFYLAGENLFA